MMATQTIYPFIGGIQARRRAEGNNFENPMLCKDGWIIVQAGGGATWEDLANFFETPELLEPRFANRDERARNGAEMDRIILESIKEREKWELFPKAAAARMLFRHRADSPGIGGTALNWSRGGSTGRWSIRSIGNIKVPAELVQAERNSLSAEAGRSDAGSAQPGNLC